MTPIFTTSYSGLFKSFIDVLDPDALSGMPVLLGATGGTERHSLALEYAMRPLFSYLHAVAAARPSTRRPATGGAPATRRPAGCPERIDRAAGELAALVRVADRSTRVRDPFALPAGFSPVGGFGAADADRQPVRGSFPSVGAREVAEERDRRRGDLPAGVVVADGRRAVAGLESVVAELRVGGALDDDEPGVLGEDRIGTRRSCRGWRVRPGYPRSMS